MILAGALVIGFISGEERVHVTEAFFLGSLQRHSVYIMLKMGLFAGKRLAEIKNVGTFPVSFGVIIPIVNGFLGVLVGKAAQDSL